MPIEDGHMKCVLCLGEDHASAAREDPSSCMNCFIIPRPSLEARYCLFRGKKRKASFTELSQEKRDRGLGTRSKTPMIGPPLTITVHDTSEPHEQEDVSDVDVECMSDSDLAPDQEGTASVANEGASSRGREEYCFSLGNQAAAMALPVTTAAGGSKPRRHADVRGKCLGWLCGGGSGRVQVPHPGHLHKPVSSKTGAHGTYVPPLRPSGDGTGAKGGHQVLGFRLRADPSLRLSPDARMDPACFPDIETRRTAWMAMGASPWVVSTMTQGYRIQFLRKPPTSVSPLVVTQVHSEHRAVLLSEISTLLEKKAIREVPPGDRQVGFYSRYFLIPKKDGNLRPILDLRGLNRFIRPLRCKMLTVSRVRQFICRGDWFVTIDLKDAYFQIPIWKGHWRFLRFVFNGKVYEFQVLPFGISLAPRTFTRCMEAVLSPLRQEGIRILNYLDDWLLCAGTQQECRAHLSLLLEHLRQLGLRLNYEKSHLVPSQETHFLGLVLNSQAASLTLSQARLMSFESCLSQFRLGARVTWRQCLRLMGLMASMSQAVPLALLNMRPVQRYLLGLALKKRTTENHREVVEEESRCEEGGFPASALDGLFSIKEKPQRHLPTPPSPPC
uniref:ribonuclease H n=1 Tax=Knipowitschia caucasica TaxID=637954 RepID=A0AAV2M5I6_KNICA